MAYKMKIRCCFVLIIFFFAGEIFSQERTAGVFHLDGLQTQGILLNKGWKFHSGDNPEWAKPGFKSAWRRFKSENG